MTRLYLSGPITGDPDYVAKFRRAADDLRYRGGHLVLDPTTITDADGWGWGDYMREAITMMLRADAVAMLPNWHQSRGATIEHTLALVLGMETRTVAGWLP